MPEVRAAHTADLDVTTRSAARALLNEVFEDDHLRLVRRRSLVTRYRVVVRTAQVSG